MHEFVSYVMDALLVLVLKCRHEENTAPFGHIQTSLHFLCFLPAAIALSSTSSFVFRTSCFHIMCPMVSWCYHCHVWPKTPAAWYWLHRIPDDSKCQERSVPLYLSDCCVPVTDADTRRYLRSVNHQLLAVPWFWLNPYDRRAFSVAALPLVWLTRQSLSDQCRQLQTFT